MDKYLIRKARIQDSSPVQYIKLLLLSIYKIFFLLDYVIYACWGTPWKKFLESPLFLQEFIQAQTEEPAPPRLPLMQQWRPPNSQCYKVNFDAVVFCATSRVGIGIIARDSEGVALGALSSSIPLSSVCSFFSC